MNASLESDRQCMWIVVAGQNRDVEYGVADRGNIATIVVLKPSRAVALADDPSRLVIGNTHLLYNPKRCEKCPFLAPF